MGQLMATISEWLYSCGLHKKDVTHESRAAHSGQTIIGAIIMCRWVGALPKGEKAIIIMQRRACW